MQVVCSLVVERYKFSTNFRTPGFYPYVARSPWIESSLIINISFEARCSAQVFDVGLEQARSKRIIKVAEIQFVQGKVRL